MFRPVGFLHFCAPFCNHFGNNRAMFVALALQCSRRCYSHYSRSSVNSDFKLVNHDVLVTTARLSTDASSVVLSGTLLLAERHDGSKSSSNSISSTSNSSSNSRSVYWSPRKPHQKHNASSINSRTGGMTLPPDRCTVVSVIKLHPVVAGKQMGNNANTASIASNPSIVIQLLEEHLLTDILGPLARYAATSASTTTNTTDNILSSVTICPVPCNPVLEEKCYATPGHPVEEQGAPLCLGEAFQKELDMAWLRHVAEIFSGGRVVCVGSDEVTLQPGNSANADSGTPAGLTVWVMSLKDLLNILCVNKRGIQKDAKGDAQLRHTLLKAATKNKNKTSTEPVPPPLDYLVVFRIHRWSMIKTVTGMLARLSSPEKRVATTTITICDDDTRIKAMTPSTRNASLSADDAKITQMNSVTDYLNRNLNNKRFAASLELFEREEILLELQSLKELQNDKPIAFRLLSPRGSGKTQLIKKFVYECMNEECARGGVIVIECYGLSDYQECIQDLLRSTPLNHNAIHHFVINVISRHIGRRWQDFATVDEAYSAWVSMCGVERPLLIFDTVEALPAYCDVLRADRSQRSTIEEISRCVPPGYAVLFVGTSTGVVRFSPTNTFYKNLNPLEPLSFAGYIKARNFVWRHYPLYPDGCTDTTRADWLLYALGGGLPRFMQLIDIVFSKTKDWSNNMARLQRLIPMHIGDINNKVANFIGFLMAGTVYDVKNLDDTVPHTDQTYRELTMGILLPKCVGSKYEFSVCPLMAIYLMNKDTYTPPNEWGPLPRRFNLAMLFFPWKLDEVLIPIHTERGKPFERIVANALVGRYYLLHNMGESLVTLARLLNVARGTEGYDMLSKLSVNLSGGICFSSPPPHDVRMYFTGNCDDDDNSDISNALVYSSEKYAKHDMCFTAHWNSEYAPKGSAIKYTTGKECHIAIQCRHGYPKQPAELLTQVTGTPDDDDMLLLVVQLCDEPLPPANNPVWKELQEQKPTHCKALQRLLERGMLRTVDASRFCRVWAPYLLTPGQPFLRGSGLLVPN